MIKEVKMYTVVCNNCGCQVNEGEGIVAWNDKDYALDEASDADWISNGDKHYCSSCYHYDDEDNLIIETKERSKK